MGRIPPVGLTSPRYDLYGFHYEKGRDCAYQATSYDPKRDQAQAEEYEPHFVECNAVPRVNEQHADEKRQAERNREAPLHSPFRHGHYNENRQRRYQRGQWNDEETGKIQA
jgi:hypothetical protein